MSDVIANVIRPEDENAPFISIQGDETTGCATYTQHFIIAKNVTEYNILKRSVGFYWNNNKSTSRLADVIENVLDFTKMQKQICFYPLIFNGLSTLQELFYTKR